VRRIARAVAVVAVAALLATGCSVRVDLGPDPGGVSPTGPGESTPEALAPFYSQRLDWRECDGPFECATLTVPVSYDDPTGPTLGVNVVRLPASGDRLGSLVLNPGGPGGSGVDYARAARAVTSDPVREAYDVVGFDPRGVASSDPIDCLDDAQTDAFIAADASPDTPAEESEATRLSAAFGAACEQRSPQLVAHIGTEDVARDLDVLRAALGDPRLTYLGKSYGTAIGATYAELFPRNVGRMVLDGAMDPSLDSVQLSKGQAAGFELALRRFAEACPTIADCPLSSNPEEGVQQVRDFLARTDAAPLTTDQGRPLTEALAVLGIIGSLYSRDGWEVLSAALGLAFGGDGSALLSIGDRYTDRESDGSYSSNANDAIYAVNCWDKPATPDAAATARLAEQWGREHPTFGAYLAWGMLPCATWPGHSATEPHAVVAPGTPEILVIGTTNDPATPVEWARALAGQLSKGVLLEWQGDGHTAYSRGSGCIDEKVDAFYLEGIVPPDGTVCQ